MNGTPDPILYVWDVEADQVQTFNFKTGESQDGLDENVSFAQQQLTADLKGFSSHYY